MGGTIGLLAAERLSSRLGALVVAEGLLQEESDTWAERIVSEPPDLWERSFADLQRRAKYFVRGSMLRRREEAIERVAPSLLQTTALAMRASAASLRETSADPGLYGRYRALAMPKRYLVGDLNERVALAERLREDGEVVDVVARAGHMLLLDNPVGFYGAVARAGATTSSSSR
jgi:pimeloyl-ACP methyl ester carboxylesterase